MVARPRNNCDSDKSSLNQRITLLRLIIYSVFLLSLWSTHRFYHDLLQYQHQSILVDDDMAETPNSQKQANDRALKTILSARDDNEANWDYPDIDVVYTYVNGSDPVWLSEKNKYYPQFLKEMMGLDESTEGFKKDTVAMRNGNNRYNNHDELKYSLRSIEKYAPWVRNIFIVVANEQSQVPSWLNTSHPKINIVPHAKIFRDPKNLPSFNSNAIESQICEIPGLADYFLYFNDDTFLGEEVYPGDFLVSKFTGEQVIYDEGWPVKWTCSEGCSYSRLGDGHCDNACNVPSCNWDFGDCVRGFDKLKAKAIEFRSKYGNGRNRYEIEDGYPIFWTSILHTDGALNREFRIRRKPRNVIPHIPYFFNKHLLKDLVHRRLKQEYAWNDSHRFRHPEDITTAFAYIHYLNAVKVFAPTEKQAWRAAFDTVSKPGADFLFDYDLHSQQRRSSTSEKYVDGVERARKEQIMVSKEYHLLQNCAKAIIANESVNALKCSNTMAKLRNSLSLRLPYNSDTKGVLDVSFVTLGDDDESNRSAFKDILRKRKKFVTINDDMTVQQPKTNEALRSFYQIYFPKSSVYELKN